MFVVLLEPENGERALPVYVGEADTLKCARKLYEEYRRLYPKAYTVRLLKSMKSERGEWRW